MYRVNELDEPIWTEHHTLRRTICKFATVYHISKPTSNNLRGINIDANAPECHYSTAINLYSAVYCSRGAVIVMDLNLLLSGSITVTNNASIVKFVASVTTI